MSTISATDIISIIKSEIEQFDWNEDEGHVEVLESFKLFDRGVIVGVVIHLASYKLLIRVSENAHFRNIEAFQLILGIDAESPCESDTG